MKAVDCLSDKYYRFLTAQKLYSSGEQLQRQNFKNGKTLRNIQFSDINKFIKKVENERLNKQANIQHRPLGVSKNNQLIEFIADLPNLV